LIVIKRFIAKNTLEKAVAVDGSNNAGIWEPPTTGGQRRFGGGIPNAVAILTAFPK